MTGQVCSTTGDYEFDGYVDASLSPLLGEDEKRIVVNAGKAFPPACPTDKSAYWKFTGWH